MAKRRYWKIILGSIVAIVCIYCFVCLFLIAKYGWSRARPFVEVPGIGSFKYIGSADSCTFRVKKNDATEVNIMYVNGVCKDKIVLHPKGHPLKGRVRADADGKTLHELTELFPTLVRIANGREKNIPERVLRALEDFPADMYDYHFKKEPGKYHLQINENLYLKGYDFRPHAQMPYVAYWGPQWADNLGDDIIYCGNWVLDKFCQNLPLKIGPENLQKVKAGDVIDFEGCKLITSRYLSMIAGTTPLARTAILRTSRHACTKPCRPTVVSLGSTLLSPQCHSFPPPDTTLSRILHTWAITTTVRRTPRAFSTLGRTAGTSQRHLPALQIHRPQPVAPIRMLLGFMSA